MDEVARGWFHSLGSDNGESRNEWLLIDHVSLLRGFR